MGITLLLFTTAQFASWPCDRTEFGFSSRSFVLLQYLHTQKIMKKKVTTLVLYFLSLVVYVQAQPGSRLGVQLSGLDFFGPQKGSYFYEQSDTFRNFNWDPAFVIFLQQAVSPHFDLQACLNLSSLSLPMKKNDSLYRLSKLRKGAIKNQQAFVNLLASAVFSISDQRRHLFTPQIQIGAGYYFQRENNGVNLHAGPGFRLQCARQIYLHTGAIYHFSLTNNAQHYVQYTLGAMYAFGKNMAKVPHENKAKAKHKVDEMKIIPQATYPPVVLQDTDNDGIPDQDDNCITEPGRKETFGCPDRDRDGVADKQDLCPEVKGSKAARGCPDRDNDGVSDEKDECPDEAGKNGNGCPDTQTEQQNLPPDDEKKSEVNDPEINVEKNVQVAEQYKQIVETVKAAAAKIQFNSGTAYIHPASYAALDTIVQILQRDSVLHVDIEGHTDNVGNEQQNLQLSQQRADACKNYLLQKGIAESRLSAIGYGDMNPVADNHTAEGRMMNRRTEFLIILPKN